MKPKTRAIFSRRSSPKAYAELCVTTAIASSIFLKPHSPCALTKSSKAGSDAHFNNNLTDDAMSLASQLSAPRDSGGLTSDSGVDLGADLALGPGTDLGSDSDDSGGLTSGSGVDSGNSGPGANSGDSDLGADSGVDSGDSGPGANSGDSDLGDSDGLTSDSGVDLGGVGAGVDLGDSGEFDGGPVDKLGEDGFVVTVDELGDGGFVVTVPESCESPPV